MSLFQRLFKSCDLNIVPEGRKFNSPILGHWVKATDLALMRSEISYHRWKRASLLQCSMDGYQKIEVFLSEEQYEPIFKKIQWTEYETPRDKHKAVHEKKLGKLGHRPTNQVDNKIVINMSSTDDNWRNNPSSTKLKRGVAEEYGWYIPHREPRQGNSGKILRTLKPTASNRRIHDGDKKQQLPTILGCPGYKKSRKYRVNCSSEANPYRVILQLCFKSFGNYKTTIYNTIVTLRSRNQWKNSWET